MQLCRVCGQWVNGNDKQWQKHLLSERHQACLHRIASLEKERECGVFVTRFNTQTITLDILKSLFNRFGNIVAAYLDPNKRFATLQFDSRISACCALKTGVYFENQRLVVKPRIIKQCQLASPPIAVPATREITLSPNGSWEQQTHDLMRALAILHNPSENGEDACLSQVQVDIQRALAPTFGSCETYIFGSRKTGMARLDSDVDVFADLSNSEYMKNLSHKELKDKTTDPKTFHDNLFRMCVKSIRKSGLFKNILGVSRARIPIIKFLHLNTGIQGDVSFKNCLGVWNSELLKYYIDLDVRVRFLVVIIRHWLSNLSSPFLSSYTMCMMLCNYLQNLPDPIVPSLQQLLDADTQNIYADGWHCSFDPIAFSTNNTQNIKELLQGFFAYLANFDFGVDVLCCINGSAVPKWRFLHPDFLPEDQKTLKQVMLMDEAHSLPVKTPVCVQNVMELNHSTTKAMNQTHLLELRQCCAASSEYCANETSTLQGLFSLQMKPLYPPDVVVLEFANFFPPLEDLKNGVNIKVCWMEKVVSILQQVFLHVLHMKFVKEPAVSEIKINGESQIWSLESKYCLWEFRNIAKASKTTDNLTFLEKEIKESQKLITNALLTKVNRDENETKVSIYIKLISPPTRIQLEIETQTKKDLLLQYLQCNLQTFVERGLKEACSTVTLPAEDSIAVQQALMSEKLALKPVRVKSNASNVKHQTVSSRDVIEVDTESDVSDLENNILSSGGSQSESNSGAAKLLSALGSSGFSDLENSVLYSEGSQTESSTTIISSREKLLSALESSISCSESDHTMDITDDVVISDPINIDINTKTFAENMSSSEDELTINDSSMMDVSIAKVTKNVSLGETSRVREHSKRKACLSESSEVDCFVPPEGYVLVKSYVYDPETKEEVETVVNCESNVSSNTTSSFKLPKSRSNKRACKRSKLDV